MKNRIIILFFSAFLLLAFNCHAQDSLPELDRHNVNFILISDSGMASEAQRETARKTAAVMTEIIGKNRISFIAVAGDPIHDMGVKDEYDPEWKFKLEDIFGSKELHSVPWYAVPGNHEYKGNPEAMVRYAGISKRWKMPARYYSIERKILKSDAEVLIAFLDTPPLIRSRLEAYVAEGKASPDYPDKEMQWLDSLWSVSDQKWKIAVGHHPVYANTAKGIRERQDMQDRLNPLLLKHDADLYVCGHIHSFQYIVPEGCKVGYIVNSSAGRSREVGPIEGTRFCADDTGLTLFSIGEDAIDFYFIDSDGKVLYHDTVTEDGPAPAGGIRIDSVSVMGACNSVADWQIDNISKSGHHELEWTNGVLYKGMTMWGAVSGQEKYLDFVRGIGEKHSWRMYDRPYHADDICVGQAFIDLYRIYGDSRMLQPVLERGFYVSNHPSKAVLSKNDPAGKFERWSWCDALFMAAPVYAALYEMTGEKCYADYLDHEFRVCTDSLYDRSACLYYRDCNRIPLREPNGGKQFWGRGNGWVFAAIPLVLDNLPENHPTRPYYEKIFRDMAGSVIDAQDETGAWHASMLDPHAYPMPENSGSALFCYGLAWGINNGLLEGPAWPEALMKGWNSLQSYILPDGKLGYIQPVGAAPVSVGAESTDVYGVGGFLLAGSELLKWLGTRQF